MTTQTKKSIEFTRVNNDTNGNPRYVCHFLNFCKAGEFDNLASTDKDGNIIMTAGEVIQLVHGMNMIQYKYKRALKRAKTLGGRKFHNKQYGGGIVFQSYNIGDTEQRILELMKTIR